jgi:hypothetical protein
MQKMIVLAAAVALPLVFVQGCGDDGLTTGAASDTNDTNDGGEEQCDGVVSGTIESDTTWACGHTLDGIVNVKNGAKLTVMPGVTIKGNAGSALIVSRGSQLIAEGTKDAPIVFTSAGGPGNRARGDWGGIVLLGDAANNLPNGVGAAEGLEATNPDYQYGGSDAGYSCGSLKWLRVEFAGFELTKDNELNGITFYSCGSGTTVDYVQAHMGKDDGIEMFGGSFDAKHIVVTGALDDSLDMDLGYTGKLQYVYVHQEKSAGNYAFELSNQKDGFDAAPRTRPVFANVTAIGTAAIDKIETGSGGVRLKEGAGGEFHNTIFAGFYNAAVEVTEPATEVAATAGESAFKNTLFWNNAVIDAGVSQFLGDDGSSFDVKGWIEDAANANHVGVDPLLGAYEIGGDIAPRAGSPVLGAGAAAAGFEATDFIGAVKDAASDWTKGWTEFSLD